MSARRDSFDRNTSAFSPSLDYNSTNTAAAAAASAAAAARKWPVSSYGALGTMPSASPLGAPLTPPPTGNIIIFESKLFVDFFSNILIFF